MYSICVTREFRCDRLPKPTQLINAHDLSGTFAYYETCTPIHSPLLLLTVSVFVYEYLVNVYEEQKFCCSSPYIADLVLHSQKQYKEYRATRCIVNINPLCSSNK